MFEAHDSEGSEFGIERLTEAFQAIREKPADVIARGLIDAVREHAGCEPEDDQTVVVIKRGEDDPAAAGPKPGDGSATSRLTGEFPRFTG